MAPLSGQAVRDLLGKELAEVRSAVAAFEPWEVKSFPGAGKRKACRYFTSKAHGVQLCFDYEGGGAPPAEGDAGWVLSGAHLFNEGTDGFKGFQGELPLGLSMDMLNPAVVTLLGEPTSKGGHTVPVWIEYAQHGLQVNFRGFAFDDLENPVGSVVFFPAEDQVVEAE